MERAISASILSADLLHLRDEVRKIEASGADMLHFDVMDGIFVPNISFGLPVLEAVRKITDMFLDVHLMIQNPGAYIRKFAQAGADMITFHIESDGDPAGILQSIHDCGCKAGIALKPGTPAQAADPYLDQIDNLLVMTVEPGFGGQSYMHDMNAKITRFAAMRGERSFYIQVDGGIAEKTVGEAVSSGADLLVAGSYLFSQPDMGQGVSILRRGGEAAS